MSDLFNSGNADPVFEDGKDYLSELAGEGKKFKDPNSLAFGKIKSDAHIARLEKELSEMREDLSKRATLEDVLTRIETRGTAQVVQPQAETTPADEKFDPSKVRQLVEESAKKLFETQQAEAKAKANVDRVTEVLEKNWGPNYADILKTKAKELGVGEQFVTAIARDNPAVVYNLFGLNPSASGDRSGGYQAPAASKVATQAGAQNFGSEKKQSYYLKMRKDNPTLYHSKEMVVERHRQAQKLGESFFDVD